MRHLPLLCIVASLLAPIGARSAEALESRPAGINQARWIEVGGEASVNVAPDFARVTLGVTTTGKDAGEAVAANAKALNALISVLKGEGVAAADIQTSSLSITPQFSNSRSPSESEQSIVGYAVSDMVTVTERDISRLGALIDKAVGGRRQRDVRCRLWRERPEQTSRQGATSRGRRREAQGRNLRGRRRRQIGRLMELSDLTGAQPLPFARRPVAAMSAAAAPTPIEAGADRLTVSVTARFELTE